MGGSANNLTIDSPTTFNDVLKTDDITAISNTATQSIYTTLASTGTINLGNTTTGTITNIRGGAINMSGDTTITGDATITGNATIDNNLKIVENSYGNLTKTTNINQEGNSSRFTNLGSTNGNFIFTINETIDYNILVLNQTSVNIDGDANITGDAVIDGILTIRTDKLVDELQTLSGATETLFFPLQQTTIFTNTGNISATLPLINNDTQIGLRFTFLNLGSITTTTTFTAQSTNKIITIGQVTQNTSSTALINNANNSCSLVIVKLSGVYCWAEYI
jgi:hypothetical protein